MSELTYAGFIHEIPIFIDKTLPKREAYLLDLRKVFVDGIMMKIGEPIFLVPRGDYENE